jgi:hypothetical protein
VAVQYVLGYQASDVFVADLASAYTEESPPSSSLDELFD